MRVDHRCFDIAMPQELLNRSNVIAAFKDVRGKGMSECVARGGPEWCQESFRLRGLRTGELGVIPCYLPSEFLVRLGGFLGL